MVPTNPELVRRKRIRKPDDELTDDLEPLLRAHWLQVAPLGRHGYAISRTSGIVAGALFLGMWTGTFSLEYLFRGPTGDSLAWLLTLGVPSIAALYRLLLARWDQDAARFGGGATTLARWRAARAKDADDPGA